MGYKLIVPKTFIRMIPHAQSGRTRASKWHIQDPRKRKKTYCGVVIAPGYGWKFHNAARDIRMKRRERWATAPIDAARGPVCQSCLGPMEVKRI